MKSGLALPNLRNTLYYGDTDVADTAWRAGITSTSVGPDYSGSRFYGLNLEGITSGQATFELPVDFVKIGLRNNLKLGAGAQYRDRSYTARQFGYVLANFMSFDQSLLNQPIDGIFANTPDSDPSIAENRDWAKTIFRRLATSDIGSDLVLANTIYDEQTLNQVVENARTAQVIWGQLSTTQRYQYLTQVAVVLERNRQYLIEVAMSEAGKTFDQIDTEVSEAIDFANYYATQALRLDALPGATAVPRPVTLVTPPWNFPIAIPAGGVLAALAAGSSVVLKPGQPLRSRPLGPDARSSSRGSADNSPHRGKRTRCQTPISSCNQPGDPHRRL